MIQADENRDPLEVLADEFLERRRRGEHPSISEYTSRYPDMAKDIEDLFLTIDVVEQLKVSKEQGSGRCVPPVEVRPERVGDFTILGEIGRGGMGIVYEAFQESLDRHVAVKVLPSQSVRAPKQLQRFHQEAQMAAKLHHTNIVPVFGVGEDEGVHYIVMQLIQGEGLDALLARLRQAAEGETPSEDELASTEELPDSSRHGQVARLAKGLLDGSFSSSDTTTEVFQLDTKTDVEEPSAPKNENAVETTPINAQWQLGSAYWYSVAKAGQQVADALHYAHTNNTLHRDIKPANLLLDSQGVVWITDFGLAKAMDQGSATQTGAMVGTLRYMAPEQFNGHFDARSDIYSLGLTLYEMLTLVPAFEDTNQSALIGKIMHEKPVPPRKQNPEIPRDLETIVLKAIAREPRQRYQTASELARDLQNFLEDRPILARRTSSIERLWRWARRNRAVAALAASTFTLLIAVTVVASIGYFSTVRANNEEKLQRKKAEETTALAVEVLDSMFEQFAPDRVAPASAALVIDDEETVSVPVQPVLSKEAAAMLEHMITFYDRLASQGSGNVQLYRKTAEANRRVGDIRQRLGHYEQAETAYLHAIELFQRLAASATDDTELRTEIARIHNELGNVYYATNQAEAGRKSHLEALKILQASSTESAESHGCTYELARTYYYLGKRSAGMMGPPLVGQDRPRDPRGGPPDFVFDPRGSHRGPRLPFPPMPPLRGEPTLDRAVASWQRLVNDDSDWSTRGPIFAPARRTDPPPNSIEGDRKESETYRLKAVELLERLVTEFPTVPDYRHLLARCYREIRPTTNLTSNDEPYNLHKAIEILQKLVDDHPDVADYRYDLSETYAMLGSNELRENGSLDDQRRQNSMVMLEKALAISEKLVAEHPNIPEYAVSSINIRLRLDPGLRNSSSVLAEANLLKALELQYTLAHRFPENTSYTFWLGAIQETLSGMLKDEGRLSEAKSTLEDCIASFETVLEKDDKAKHVRGILAKNYMALSGILSQLGEEKAAQEASNKAREIR